MLAAEWQFTFKLKQTLFGIGIGFSSTMIGAGFLIGFEMALSILFGALINGFIALPFTSHLFPYYLAHHSSQDALNLLLNAKVRYIGIGAMLCAGVWTFLTLIKPLIQGLSRGLKSAIKGGNQYSNLSPQERDLPLGFNVLCVLILMVVSYFFFSSLLPVKAMGFSESSSYLFILTSLLYVVLFGFLFAAITGYFSGMVGVTASPGSSIIIAGLLIFASLLFYFMKHFIGVSFTTHQLQAAEAVTIIIGSVVTGIAAIANDNMQDLKVGHIIGATPWKQQLMLLLGVIVSSLVIPPIMQLLFDVYGIAGVLPHPGMDGSLSLPAPPAALMAAVTKGVFQQDLPWGSLTIGAFITVVIAFINFVLRSAKSNFSFSMLGVAVGIYLPFSSSIPLFIGGLIALLVDRRLKKRSFKEATKKARAHRGVLIACGLVAGAAIMDVILAVPFSIMGSPDALRISSGGFESSSLVLALITTFSLYLWIRKVVCFND